MHTHQHPLIDSHSHLAFSAFDDDREGVMQRAKEAGVIACLAIAVDSKTAADALLPNPRLLSSRIVLDAWVMIRWL